MLLSESDFLYENQIRQSLCPSQLVLGDGKKKVREVWFSGLLSNTGEENGGAGYAAAGPD